MAGALRKTMVYLGLAEEDARERYDDAYDEYDYDDHEPAQAQTHEREQHAVVTPLRSSVRSVGADREVNQMSRITTIHPRTYNEAKNIGESFRDGIPVIMNLTDMGDADAKRLVDFAAGLVFGLHGSIERITAKVFLLSPATVEVIGEDGSGAPTRSLFNQS
jgi:cell division inhibitor SepF